MPRSHQPYDNSAMEPLGLYIHIPFCKAKCYYCSFNSYHGLESLIPEYVSALLTEMERWSKVVRGHRVHTVYLGGGTPSLLPPEQVGRVLDGVRTRFSVTADAEVALEANPGTVDKAHFEAIRKAGVNRLSLGMQSFQPRFLKVLGRIHTAAQARQAFGWAREAGFGNVSLDLIYGLPQQTLEQWRLDLEEAAALGPEHISLYGLTLEPGTPLAETLSDEDALDPDVAADMYTLAEHVLGSAGFEHYELSNWARPGRESRHNLTYWRNLPYLGLGAGAHSCLRGFRWANVASPQEYVAAVGRPLRGRAFPWRYPQVAEVERINKRRAMAETAILGLRLCEGLDLEAVARSLGRDPKRLFQKQRRELAELGLAEEVGGRLRLTPRGRLLGNQAFQRFLPQPVHSLSARPHRDV